ncbi:immunity 42 family protein [Burkholderia cenocepacia]|uniref:immunity 42 family protein n=1 Tax=Burkholderia cenocepacia TaxID=95486 RepID=UPI001B8DDF3C|nr:immunity 42 family protein [Burkholderia cenocepacia]MBR8070653.1 immunity 42 family protein [Burkholderia cenocepacia]MBR8444882.1 immunity 42 family protein [Burkholderia cenocepacia]
MLSGNPDTFAIWFDSVDSWSTDNFKNGCFGCFIAGELIWSLRSTLGVDIHGLSLLNSMDHPVENEEIFNFPQNSAYKRLCKLAFPSLDSDAEVSDFTHLVSPESLSDEGHYMFLVEFGEQAKLISGFKEDLSSVRQVILKRGEFQGVVRSAIEKFSV